MCVKFTCIYLCCKLGKFYWGNFTEMMVSITLNIIPFLSDQKHWCMVAGCMLKQTFLFHKWINGSYKISCPIYPPFSPISNMVYRQFYSIKFLCDEHRGQSAVILLQKYTAGNNYHLWFMNGGACKMGKMIAPRLFSYTLWSTPGSRSKLSGSRIADVNSGHNDQLYFVRLLG